MILLANMECFTSAQLQPIESHSDTARFMKRSNILIKSALPAAAILLPLSAHAHHAESMSGQPFLQGLSMPAHGVDHLLSALAVGLIASQTKGSMRFKLPALFVLVSLLGGFVNLSGISLHELAVPITVACAGMVLWSRPSSLAAGGLVIAAAGLVNGQALLENPPINLPSATFGAGCLLSASALCALGLFLGHVLETKPSRLRFTAAALIFGAGLLACFPTMNSAVIRLLE
jgi:urease accessory protein